MPRRRPPPRRAAAPLRPIESRRLEEGPDGYLYEVRAIAASRATKTYRCPGCDQEIRPGTAHVVVWAEHSGDDRRHWHTPCWANGRSPTRKWS